MRTSPTKVVVKRIVESPLGRYLGLELDECEPERVVVRLPFRPEITTAGDLVHGGAISALADTAATAVAWSGVDPENPPSRGTTVSLSVDFVAGARGLDLLAEATVTRRGRSLVFCAVAVRDSAGRLVSQARALYKLG